METAESLRQSTAFFLPKRFKENFTSERDSVNNHHFECEKKTEAHTEDGTETIRDSEMNFAQERPAKRQTIWLIRRYRTLEHLHWMKRCNKSPEERDANWRETLCRSINTKNE